MPGRALTACLILAAAPGCTPMAEAQATGPDAGGTGLAQAAGPAAGDVGLRLAQSALVVVDARVEGENLALRARHVPDQSPVASDDVSIAIDGKRASVSHGSDGSTLVPLSELRGGSHTIEMILGHDGIREVLTGTVNLPETGAGSLLGSHKQLAWWILNIVIVLIAVTAISRRKG